MKRFRYHIIFWLSYIAYDAFLQVTYMHRFLIGIPDGKQILMGITSSLIVLPTKMALTYFALYVFLPSILGEKRRMGFSLAGMILTTAVCVILYRSAHYFYINPYVYGGRENRPHFFAFVNIWEAAFEIWSVAAIAIIIKFVRVQFQDKEKEKVLVKEKLETELKFLRNQTNPHFLFNTLNNIYALALKKSDDTPGIVMKLSELLHFMVYESGKKTIRIGDELKILDDYIELEKIRYNRRLAIDFVREIDDEQEKIAPLLLLSFVENAFKHGASESRFESYIRMHISVRAGLLNFKIENTREWCDKPVSNGQIGLTNSRRQIELLYTDYTLDVLDEREFFKVHLIINLHSHAKI